MLIWVVLVGLLAIALRAILAPDVGEVELLKRTLYLAATSEHGSLRWFKNNITPAESDTAGTFTIADFTGYANMTLTSSQTGGTWGVPATAAGVTTSTYGTVMTGTNTGSAQTIYGAYCVGGTSGTLWFSDLFAASRVLNTGDILNYTPKIGLD